MWTHFKRQRNAQYGVISNPIQPLQNRRRFPSSFPPTHTLCNRHLRPLTPFISGFGENGLREETKAKHKHSLCCRVETIKQWRLLNMSCWGWGVMLQPDSPLRSLSSRGNRHWGNGGGEVGNSRRCHWRIGHEQGGVGWLPLGHLQSKKNENKQIVCKRVGWDCDSAEFEGERSCSLEKWFSGGMRRKTWASREAGEGLPWRRVSNPPLPIDIQGRGGLALIGGPVGQIG